MYAVVGSTGQVGGAALRALRAQGCEVRAILRNPSKAGALEALGAETFLTDTEDSAHLEIAFEKVEGAFFMIPPLPGAQNPRLEHQMAIAVAVHAVQASHVPKVVFLSSIGAQIAQGTGAILSTHALEQAMLPIGMSMASIRACSFMENLRSLLPHIRETGKFSTFYEDLDAPAALVAAEDIGKLAAGLLTEPWEAKRIIEFEGPRPYSINEQAALMSEVFHRPVTPEIVPKDQRVSMFEQFGMSPAAAADLAEMYDGFNSGLLAFEGGEGIEHRRGETTFEKWLEGALAAN